MKRKSKFIISVLMSVILLLSVVLGIIIYQLKKIVSPEVIDEAVIKNINEGFDMIAEELETIELEGE